MKNDVGVALQTDGAIRLSIDTGRSVAFAELTRDGARALVTALEACLNHGKAGERR